MKQYTSFLFPAPEFIGLLMDLNVTQTGLRHLSEFMTRRGIDYTAATAHTLPRPIPTRQAFLDTWKDMAKLLELRPAATVETKRLVAVVGPCTHGSATFNQVQH